MDTPSLRLDRGRGWRRWVCFLLLLATMVNYMDRLTLNLLASHINADLGLDKNDYATIEMGFALAFAAGAVVFGFLVDRFNAFWVYPLAVIAWSAAGFATGLANTFAMLLFFRVLLGLAESANWPCALRTTQRILPPAERSMGNSILQSGAALGAVLIPLVMFFLFDKDDPTSWRRPFLVVGAAGAGWVLLWWASVRPASLRQAPEAAAFRPAAAAALPPGLFARRYGVLIVLVVTINMTWHFLRAWGPLYLKEECRFSDDGLFWFSSAYYVCADLGALTAGYLTLRLARGGRAVHAGRKLVFLLYALLTAFCLAVPLLAGHAGGWPLAAALLLVGFGSLGVFPNYYSFTQDLTVRHQGKITGTLGCLCWLALALWQKAIGWLVTGTGSYTVPFVIAGLAPLVGFLALELFWGEAEDAAVPLAVSRPASAVTTAGLTPAAAGASPHIQAAVTPPAAGSVG